MPSRIDSTIAPEPEGRNMGGGSDDIGDVSWTVPTVTLRYPSNIPGLPGHHWSSAIASATPIAHKGATAGAKAMATTILDILAKPALVDSAWSNERPATFLNTDILEKYRPQMRRFYYDPTRFDTYLEQLGIQYPTLRKSAEKCEETPAVP